MIKKKLKWRCMERGMVENELILKSYQKKYMDNMNYKQLKEFEVFLDESDPDLYTWFSGRVPFLQEYIYSSFRKLFTRGIIIIQQQENVMSP